VKLEVPPEAEIGLEAPKLKGVPSSLVTGWGARVILVQVTVVPTLTASVAGLTGATVSG
jgi:hypothetical protein